MKTKTKFLKDSISININFNINNIKKKLNYNKKIILKFIKIK